MKYDRKHHLTTQQLADLMGIPVSNLAGSIRSPDAPLALFQALIDGRKQSVYDRVAAVLWVDSNRPKTQRQPGAIVRPAAVRPVSEQGQYRPSPQLTINQQRAAELYPHRLITPDGVGNGIDHGQNKRRFAL
ncbi:hypothetical protein H0A73_17375 [Alcaligenaceae bacterium]|nr:hypothetical protein [Alcaligenaceae bacterium]